MAYQQNLTAKNPISGASLDITVFGSPRDDAQKIDANVFVMLGSGGLHADLRLSPTDARALATHLAMAAIVAERGDAETIDFDLSEPVAEAA